MNSPAAESAESAICSKCQAYCCQLKVLLMPDDNVPEHFIDRDEHGLDIMGKFDDGWCAALDRDTFLCTIYSQRPAVCREFEMGAPDCLEERAAWRRIAISLA